VLAAPDGAAEQVAGQAQQAFVEKVAPHALTDETLTHDLNYYSHQHQQHTHLPPFTLSNQ